MPRLAASYVVGVSASRSRTPAGVLLAYKVPTGNQETASLRQTTIIRYSSYYYWRCSVQEGS